MAEVQSKALLSLLKSLRRNAAKDNVTVVTGYSARYAIWVHELTAMKLKGQPRPGNRGSFWDPPGRGQAKYLEAPARRLGRTVLGKIARTVYKRTHSMEQALLVAGLRLQRESQKLVPVDFGILKASAFTEVDK